MNNKILLINPPYNIKRYMGGLGKIGWVFPPMGLLYIASFIRKNIPNLQVKVFDFQVEEKNFTRFLKSFKPNIVGITCPSALVYSTLDIAKNIKKQFPNTKIIVGGAHATLRPKDLLSSNDIDIAVRGEGEEALFEIINAFNSSGSISNIKGISYKDKSNKIVHIESRPIQPDVDKFSMPALDLVPIDRYRISPDMRTGEKLGVILTARGCPYNCIFCANKLLTQKTYRMRSIKNVIKEIDYYFEHSGIDQLMIFDDNFAVNKARTIKLCDEFIKRGYPKKFNWWAEARVDCLDEELLKKMKQAGCSILSLGLESGNQRLLDLINKGITISETEKIVKLVHKVGIYSRASFILGLPTETRKESLNTIKFAYRLPLDQVRFSIATPFPGTELWNIAIKEGKIDPENIDWTKLSLMGGYAEYNPLYYPEGRTPREIKKLQKRANFFFFLRPRIIFGYFKRLKSLSDAKHLLKGFFHFLKASMSRN